MDRTSTSTSEITPELAVREFLRENPIKVSAFELQQFFGANLEEEELSYTTDEMEEKLPDFVEKNKKMMEELEKWCLLMVPTIKKISIMTLLGMITEITKTTQVFAYFPDFPKEPASKLLDHIFPDNSLSSEEKILEYEKIAKSTPKVLDYLVSWRNDVIKFIYGLEMFQEKNGDDLSETQKERIEQLLEKSRRTIPQINLKIEQKEIESTAELQEFERFYKVMSKQEKYSNLNPRVARTQLQLIYDESDHDLRRIVAGSAVEMDPKEEEMEEEEEEKTPRKRSHDEKHEKPITSSFRRTSSRRKHKIVAFSPQQRQTESSEETENGKWSSIF